MAEDSGAFKTNPRNSAKFRQFVMPGRPLHDATPARKRFPECGRTSTPPIFSKRRRFVAVFSNQPDSLRPGASDASRTRPIQWSPRSLTSRAFAQTLAKAESASPCFPASVSLFAAIVLSMSILVFGLGAAALLRAAHEEFASNSSWRAAREAMFAQQSDATRPVLAMLRVEPLASEQKISDSVPAVAEPATA